MRNCLFRVLISRIRVQVGSAGEAAQLHRFLAVESFCPGGGKVCERKAILMSLPNGDWRDRVHVDVYVQDMVGIANPYTLAMETANGLVEVLLYRKCRFKQERNWKGERSFVISRSWTSFTDFSSQRMLSFARGRRREQ